MVAPRYETGTEVELALQNVRLALSIGMIDVPRAQQMLGEISTAVYGMVRPPPVVRWCAAATHARPSYSN